MSKKNAFRKQALGFAAVCLSVGGLMLAGQAQHSMAQDAAAKKGEAKAKAVSDPSTKDAKQADVVLPSFKGAISPMPTGITSFGAVAAGGWIYIAGGNRDAAHVYTEEGMNHDFLRVNIKDRSKWEKLPGSFPMLSLALVAHEGKLYRTGGARVQSVGESTMPLSVDEFACFDPATKQWTDYPAMPSERSSHDSCVLDGVLYVAGGWNMREEGRTWCDEIWSYDLSQGADGEWKTAPQPFALRAAGAAAAHGKVWLTGGMTDKGQFSTKTYVYNPADQSWSDGPEIPSSAFGATMATPHGNPTFSAMDGQVYTLSDAGNAWQSLGKLFGPRYFHRVVGVGDDELAFVSGLMNGERCNFIEWMSSSATQNRKRQAHIVLENPGPSKNRQGVFLIGGKLYMAGGNDGLEQHDFAAERFQNAARVLNLQTFEAEEFEAMPVNRQSMVTTICSPRAFLGEEYWNDLSPREQRAAQPEPLLIGGFGFSEGGERATTQKDVLHYDTLLQSWKKIGELPRGMTQFASLEHDGAVYIFGGMDFDRERGEKNQFQYVTAVLKAELGGTELKFEESGIEIPRHRRALASAVLDGKLYMVGGMTVGFGPVAPVDVYDFASGEWSVIPSPNRVRISADLIPLNGKLYLMGGSSFEDGQVLPEPSIEVFDPRTNQWSELDQLLPIDPNHMRTAVVGNSILLMSTQNDKGELHLIYMQPE